MFTLNVGCGQDSWGDIRLDIRKRYGPFDRPTTLNVRTDVYYLPFRDDCFDVVRCRHVLEHLRSPEGALNEIKRVTRVGGLLDLVVPLGDGFRDETIRGILTLSLPVFKQGLWIRRKNEHLWIVKPSWFERQLEGWNSEFIRNSSYLLRDIAASRTKGARLLRRLLGFVGASYAIRFGELNIRAVKPWISQS